MGKGIAALSYLPAVDLVITPLEAEAASLEAWKGLAKKVAEMQEAEVADAAYTNVPVNMNDPFHSALFDITVSASGTVYTVSFVSEVQDENLGAIGRAALSTRRAVDIDKATGPDVTMRSFLAVLNFIEKIEDKVASTGVGATGDGTYTAVPVKGFTPFDSYTWTVTKLADLYTLTSL
jgi:hypothetical protein